jgi:carbonic anhydrase
MRRTRALILLLSSWSAVARANWNEWWTYDGISGPSYWGVINPAWALCNKGRLQSPVDVNPKRLVYDAGLTRINVDKQAVSGVLYNTGQSLVFKADANVASPPVNITGGPLAYRQVDYNNVEH